MTSTKKSSGSFLRYLLFTLIIGGLILAALAWYATTNSFQSMVRSRLVNELERITGGRVEIASVHTVPFRFQIEVRDLTIHGLEPDTDVPYAHVNSLVAQLKLRSILTFGLSFRTIILERPTIHIVCYANGTTNQPLPKFVQRGAGTAIEKLFSLSIDEFEARAGEILLNDQKIPLDFSANDVFADMNYSLFHNRYEGNLLLGKASTKFRDFRPLAWTGAAHFRLHQNELEIQSLQLFSGRSRIKLSGTLANFAKPTLNGSYDGSIDIEEASAIAHTSEIGDGTIVFKGKGSFGPGSFSSVGTIQANSLNWRGSALNVRGGSLDAGFSLDSDRISFPRIQGKMMAGTIEGNAEILNWQSMLTGGRNHSPGKSIQSASTVHLRFKDISAFELASSISTAKRPFSKMNLAGLVSGTIDARSKNTVASLVAETAVEVSEPPTVKPGELPIKGHARAAYRVGAGELEISEFTFSTAATQVEASGTLSDSSAVKLSVSTTNLGEWQPIFIAAGYDQPVPVKLLGPASFNGTATGRPSSITFSGKLESGNFDFVVPRTSRTPEQDIHWDSFATDFRISPAGLGLRNSQLRRHSTLISFDVNLGLFDRHYSPSSPFTAGISMHNGDLSEILSMAGYHLPASGMIDLSAQLAGTQADPEGSGTVRITNAVIDGQPIRQLNSTLSFNGGNVVFQNVRVIQSSALIEGRASYTLASHAFTFDVSGSHFDLARIPSPVSAHVAVEGELDFTARGSGTADNPALTAQINLRNLTFDQELAGDFTVNAVSQGSVLKVSGVSRFQNATLSLNGTVNPLSNWLADLDLRFSNLDVDSILKSYLHDRVTGHSVVAGDLQLRGPLLQPSELNLTGNLSAASADIQNVKFHSEGPVRFTLSNHLLNVGHFHFLGNDTDLAGEGSVRLTGDRNLDFRTRGQLNLQLLQGYTRDFISTGTVTTDMAVTGTTGSPLVQGKMEIENGSVAYIDSPSALSGLNGSVSFNQGRFEIGKLTGHVGGGDVSFSGHGDLNRGLVDFDLGLHGQGVRLRYPTGVSSSANLDLQLVGDSKASTLTGDITVTKLAITPGFDFGTYLRRTAQSSAISQTNSLLSRVKLDVHVVTIPELQMQTAVIRLSGDADLRLRGTAAKSVLLGRADVLEGQAYLNGTKFVLERGDVTFNNPVTTVPVVDLQASTRVRDYDITLNLNGPADKLNLTYRSEPPLPTMDIIGLLAFGQASQQSTQLQQAGTSSFNQDASNAILNAALNATVSNRTQRLFGVSRIKIDPQGLNTETSPTQSGPAITIEQQVASNITVSYSTNVSQTSQQVIQAEYNVTRNISIVAIRDENGVVSFDVKIRQRKK